MIILKQSRSINEWHKVFAWKPVRISRVELVDGTKVESSEFVFLCNVERRTTYTSGVRQGVEYRHCVKPKQELGNVVSSKVPE